MLLLFALSITPKRILHDAFAHHTHTYLQHTKADQDYLAKAELACDCLHLVVTAAFDLPETFLLQGTADVFFPQKVVFADHVYGLPHYFFSLHAPPVRA